MTTDLNLITIVILIVLVTNTVTIAKKQVNKEHVAAKKVRQAKDPLKGVYQARKKTGGLQNRKPKPNIILFLSDDQDVELGSLKFMPKLTKYVREQGAYFSNGFVSTPMCCPSRSSLLTGLYVHNHQVFTNNDNCSSTYWQENQEQRTFATYLSQAGYKTAYFGKYLNKYSGGHVPPGWNEWNGLVRNSRFYNYSINTNGQVKYHGFDYQDDYLPDLITNRSIEFMRDSVMSDPNTPFMTVLSYPGPHGPEDAAPQYQSLFFNVTTHHTPAYDFAPNPDKQWILRHTEKMLPIHRDFTDLLMTKRLQTLQSVDGAIEQVHKVLTEIGQLDNTYIFYTSDHGYHLGQFGLVKGKAFPFDFDTKVPLLVSGPGISKRTLRSQPVVNIDLAPTFLDIAGLVKPPHMDGKSILPLFTKGKKKFRESFLIERGKMTFERYSKVKEQSNSVLEEDQEGVLAVLNKRKLTKQERLSVECRKPRYQAPCSLDQKWVCKVKGDGSKKISRCKDRLASHKGPEGKKKPSSCQCKQGEIFGWKYTKLDQDERKMQRKFLKEHVEQEDLKKFNPKFLKTMSASLSRHGRSVLLHEESMAQVLHDMAGEEIVEVDVTMEDIAETIRNLKNTTEHFEPGCTLNRSSVVCHNEVTQDKSTWLSSRSTIKHQIQTLRAQLNELKAIRRYLREKRPVNREREMKNLPTTSETDLAFPFVESDSEVCLCDTKKGKNELKLQIKEERAQRREERRMERLIASERKRMKQEKKARRKLKKNDHCKADVRMNCFSHDNNHWKTEPKWTEGPFCACTNSNNNTYWCVRNINTTHNYLYCEYVTGMITFFDLSVDPHQLRNVFQTLTDGEVNYMHNQVINLRQFSAEKRFIERRQRVKKLQKEEKLRKWKRREKRRWSGRSRLLPAVKNYRRRG